MEAPRPENEPARLSALHRLNILDTDSEASFDRIAQIAKRVFEVEGAGVSLVDEERQWFKATCGLDIKETSREVSFCAHVVYKGDVMVVEDTEKAPRFKDNPLVQEEDGIRFYAGAPLSLEDGLHLGTLCLTDSDPRSFSSEDRVLLSELAGAATDLLEAKQAGYRVRYLSSVVEQVSDAVLITEPAPLDPPGPKITWVNEACVEMTGYQKEELVGNTPRMLQGEETDRETLDRVRAALEAEEPVEAETVNYRKDGSPYIVSWRITPVRDQDDNLTHWVAVQRDVTEERRQAEKLEYRATHDALTDTLKRQALQTQMQEALSEEESLTGAVLFIDLDRFKQVNDSLGHEAGDQLLQKVATRLEESVRSGDLVARIGGDEFAIWLPEVDSTDTALQISHRVLNRIQEPTEIEGQEIYVGASIGLVPDISDYTSADDVLGDADIAMYRSKRSIGSSITVHEPSMTKEAKEQSRLDTTLHGAVEREEFVPYFLPTIQLDTGELKGFEVLARWRKPDGTIVTPGDFLEVAEETGLIVPIGHQVIEKACRELRDLSDACGAEWEVRLSGNFSRREFFRDETRRFVVEVLDRYDIAPSRFTMEITERVIGENDTKDQSRIQELRDLGVRIEIDDFGTGFSSLETLLAFPVDGLKIDRSLTREIPENTRAVNLVKSVLNMAKELNLDVTTEGIETEPQLNTLRTFNCPLGQGYLFSKPVPADKLTTLTNSPPWTSLWSK